MAKKKQLEIPGTERPKIKEIDDAADDYADTVERRKALQEQEVLKREMLLLAMHRHELTSYRYDDRIVILSPLKEKVKVASIHDLDEGEE